MSDTSREYLRAQAEQWVPSVMAREPSVTSADKAYSYLRQTGIYIPRSYVRDVWSELRRTQDYLPVVNQAPDSFDMPRAWYQETDIHYQQEYAYKVKIEGYVLGEVEPTERYVTIVSSDVLPVGDVLDAAGSFAERYGMDLFLAPPSMEITAMLHATPELGEA